MGPDLVKAIHGVSMRMRLLRAVQEDRSSAEGLTERDLMILELLSNCGRMTVSQIAEASPNVSDSTVSTTVTKLWRDREMVSKTIDPKNQRTTIVELTGKGKEAIKLYSEQRAERFKALFQAIEMTDAEKDVFVTVLNRAIPFLDKILGLDRGTTE